MRAKIWERYVLIALLLGLLTAGMVYLFSQRFEAGDIYPAYSSYRADPVGTKMLFEGLNQLPDVDAERNLEPFTKLSTNGTSTLLVLGDSTRGWFQIGEMGTNRTIAALNRFVEAGGRLVLTYRPVIRVNERALNREDPLRRKKSADESEGVEVNQRTYRLNDRWLREWGGRLGYDQFPKGIHEVSVDVDEDASRAHGLADSFPWHTSMVLNKLSDDWTVLARRGEQPVLAERQWGDGTIVVSTDTYLLSNESLYKNRYTSFLTWLIGDKRHVIFDETHLGVERAGGVMIMARKYRLHGFFIGAAIFVLLLVWQSGSTLVPRYDRDVVFEDKRTAMGKDSAAGLFNLLRRNIPKKDIIRSCITHWRKSLPGGGTGAAAEKVRRVEECIQQDNEASKSDPVDTYRRIHRLLNERKG